MNLKNDINAENLLKSCIKGDRKSQQSLYEGFYKKMLLVCLRYSNNMDTAKDILHDGFIKVFENLKKFENKGSLEGWIRKIMVNTAIDYLRKKDFKNLDLENEVLFEWHESEDEIQIAEEYLELKGELILKKLQELKPLYRAVFNLFVMENYSHIEIAKELNINIGTSKSCLSRAKLKLKELLKIYENEFSR
ncbi:MAG: RNA polymerase sigma factor [Bacteroidales bacterium]|jgi:RNA polymerase sigma-70 factor (ECF subfamily)